MIVEDWHPVDDPAEGDQAQRDNEDRHGKLHPVREVPVGQVPLERDYGDVEPIEDDPQNR